ncbi:MAG: hypothetical protein QF384_08955 [Alphaproteobacteria bacterium]|jgi:hypothetical protein|nr:hypothetical protein [Alphaproteobacteria bacterium]MDP6830001.1 hypothetical protein [Alphaproteobacteria bacterium]MDP6875500.1 hypothetical protein [Alphaproteobacteria bacterium]
MIRKEHIGSSFDDFLAEDGLLEGSEEQAIKEMLADQVEAMMQSEGRKKVAITATPINPATRLSRDK